MFQALREHWQTLRWSTWLGWKIEANWTDPWLFAIYVVIKPLAATLILFFMFVAVGDVSAGPVAREMFHFVYVGSACYMLVGGVTFGMTWTVIADREHYGMLKYVYIGPGRLRSFLIGRGLAMGVKTALGVLITLLVGLLFGIPLTWSGIAWGWLVVFLLLGVVMLMSLGLILSGVVLNTARHGFFLSEGVAGTLYLLTGAIFPIALLPGWLQAVSRALPPTYWLEGMRRSLLEGSTVGLSFPTLSLAELALRTAGGCAVLLVAANLIFSWCERRAWRKGRFDETTGY